MESLEKKIDDMMREDGWVLKKYVNCGVSYFAWHKDGIQIDDDDIMGFDEMRDWEVAK